MNRFEAQTLALAGAVQGAWLALGIAREGEAEPAALAASLGSVLRLDAESPADIYGGLAGVRSGLRMLTSQLKGEQADPALTRIVAALVQIERRYQASPQLVDDLRRRLQAIAGAHGADNVADAAVSDALADAYLATISTLTPRVRVEGNPLLLKDDANVRRIRAALLSALRSVVLWRQLGGRPWHLLLKRRAIVESAQQLLGRSLAAV